MNRLIGTLIALLSLGTATGCYTTVIHSGRPAAGTHPGYSDRWHHGIIAGIAELSGPYDLNNICPGGWSQITTETTFLNGVAEMAIPLYTPQTVSVQCSASPAVAEQPEALMSR